MRRRCRSIGMGSDGKAVDMGIVIIGSGNWGTTLAGLFNPQQPVRLWCHSQEFIEPTRRQLAQTAGADKRRITIEVAFSSPLSADDIVIVAVPSAAVCDVARTIGETCKRPLPLLVTASKGLERSSFRTTSQMVTAVLPEATVAVLSGPNISKEIAAGRPAKAVLGCEEVHCLLRLADALSSDRLHLDMTRDKVDVELCAAMKGVFAIGAGIIAQRQMGANFMGLLLTFGLREIVELSKFLKISTEHVFGVAGLGDLIATCFSLDSRNVRLGQMLGSGTAVKDALVKVEQVVEGATTAQTVSEMAALRLRLPLFAAIAAVIETPNEAAFERFERTLLEYPGA
jgi:glycerol-3-phosphate dehydrogenase (NAD(P)+)